MSRWKPNWWYFNCLEKKFLLFVPSGLLYSARVHNHILNQLHPCSVKIEFLYCIRQMVWHSPWWSYQSLAADRFGLRATSLSPFFTCVPFSFVPYFLLPSSLFFSIFLLSYSFYLSRFTYHKMKCYFWIKQPDPNLTVKNFINQMNHILDYSYGFPSFLFARKHKSAFSKWLSFISSKQREPFIHEDFFIPLLTSKMQPKILNVFETVTINSKIFSICVGLPKNKFRLREKLSRILPPSV